MTAYGAVISLKNTIDIILHSSHFSLVEPSPTIIQRAYNELQPLQEIMERLDSSSPSRSRKEVNALDGRIKEKIWEFEDILESLLTDQILSQFPAAEQEQVDGNGDGGIEETRVWEFQGSLLESSHIPSESQIPQEQVDGDGGMKETTVWESHIPSQQFQFESPTPPDTSNIHSRRRRRKRSLVHKHNVDRLKSRRKSHASHSAGSSGCEGDVLLFSIDLQSLQDDVPPFIHALWAMETEYIYELDNMVEDECISSGIGLDFGGAKSKMIGLSDQFEEVKDKVLDGYISYDTYVLVGMAGVGKTTLAREIYEDGEIMSHFECRAWVTVGRVPQQLTQLSQSILAQLCGITLTQGDEITGDHLKERLEGKKCLIVLDDVWDTEVLNSLKYWLPSYIEFKFSQKVLVTARDLRVTSRDLRVTSWINAVVVRFLNEEESKELLCEKVFGDKELCPPELDKAATKIAKNCEGLPLMIVTVADSLSKSQNRDPEYWDDVAEERNSVFKDAYDEISKVLYPSYDYLPQYLKMPFLYMGVFPRGYDFPPSKIINMLAAEGWFLDTNIKESFASYVWTCLDELCLYKNLVLFNRKSIFWNGSFCHGMLKTCRLHSAWRHLCRGEARKIKFYNVLHRLIDGSEEWIKGQCCLCLENNILFGIKEFCDLVRLNCAFSIRSLLFVGPYHQYPTPIDVGFRLLRELDALNLRFYTFPSEILTLVQLKYLALTCNGELPTTISKLFNLRVLIIHPHINVKYSGYPSYTPIQIWDMEELEHIEILGKSLVAPYDHVASLEKLSTLVGVNASICTIFKLSRRIPNIRKLGVQIEVKPYDDHNDLLSCFGCISTIGSLGTLKCSIINPVVQYGYAVPATPSLLMLPHGLTKLHLSGMGFPWEYMDVIGTLMFLQVLKLRSYAFRGSKWETQKESFLRLEFLLIEDSDLVQWKPGPGSFNNLSYLSMKYCYKLVEIHWPSRSALGKIELVDCNPLALTCAIHLELLQDTHLHITPSSHFDEKPTTIKLQSYGRAKTEWPEWSNMFSGLMFIAEPDWPDTTSSRHMFIFSMIVLLGCFLKSRILAYFFGIC